MVEYEVDSAMGARKTLVLGSSGTTAKPPFPSWGGGATESPPDQMHTWHHGVGREFCSSAIAPRHLMLHACVACHLASMHVSCCICKNCMARYFWHAGGVFSLAAILTNAFKVHMIRSTTGVWLRARKQASASLNSKPSK